MGSDAHQRQVTNDPIGYMDFTWGKATAFRTYEFDRKIVPVTGQPWPDETVDISSRLGRRFAIEGLLKIPYLPALIGVDVNLRSNSRDTEPNDFRFVMAFRVDAQKALGKVFGAEALRQ